MDDINILCSQVQAEADDQGRSPDQVKFEGFSLLGVLDQF
jgi:hypothetical protein